MMILSKRSEPEDNGRKPKAYSGTRGSGAGTFLLEIGIEIPNSFLGNLATSRPVYRPFRRFVCET